MLLSEDYRWRRTGPGCLKNCRQRATEERNALDETDTRRLIAALGNIHTGPSLGVRLGGEARSVRDSYDNTRDL